MKYVTHLYFGATAQVGIPCDILKSCNVLGSMSGYIIELETGERVVSYKHELIHNARI